MLTNTTNIHNVSEEYKNDETSEAQAAKQTETEEKQNKQLKPGATKETWINQHAADKYAVWLSTVWWFKRIECLAQTCSMPQMKN